MSERYLQLDDRLYRYILDHSLRETPEQVGLREATRRIRTAACRSRQNRASSWRCWPG